MRPVSELGVDAGMSDLTDVISNSRSGFTDTELGDLQFGLNRLSVNEMERLAIHTGISSNILDANVLNHLLSPTQMMEVLDILVTRTLFENDSEK